MRRGQISVGLDAATEPSYCLGVGIELHLGEADVEQPPEGVYIARRQAKGFVDMDLGLSTATEYILGQTYMSICVGQIPIQSQGLLAFFDAFRRAVSRNFDAT